MVSSAPSSPPTAVRTTDRTSSSITVQWGPVDCLQRNGDITGYSAQYGVQEIGSSQAMSVMGGVTTETIITGLMPSTTYSIEVAAVNTINTGVYSNPLSVITEGKGFFQMIKTLIIHSLTPAVVAPVVMSVGRTTPTTIPLSWMSAGSVVDNYEVMWERDTSGKCPGVDEGSATITGGSTSYTISGLEEDSSYTITVTATNAAGSAVSVPVTAMTGEAGEGLVTWYE